MRRLKYLEAGETYFHNRGTKKEWEPHSRLFEDNPGEFLLSINNAPNDVHPLKLCHTVFPYIHPIKGSQEEVQLRPKRLTFAEKPLREREAVHADFSIGEIIPSISLTGITRPSMSRTGFGLCVLWVATENTMKAARLVKRPIRSAVTISDHHVGKV